MSDKTPPLENRHHHQTGRIQILLQSQFGYKQVRFVAYDQAHVIAGDKGNEELQLTGQKPPNNYFTYLLLDRGGGAFHSSCARDALFAALDVLAGS
ncbi:MAG: hypothetical protein GEU87_17925 [Alphaproteobacteria bacterium]|nr:hypothetical protein [Alphaproteobacteria bacterium]